MRVSTWLVVLVVAVAVLPAVAGDRPESDSYELRTWAAVSGAPDGDPLLTSTTYRLRSRLGGPFVGSAESASFALWGCSAYTPVEAIFFASLTEPLCVTLRWLVATLDGIRGFNVRRADDLEEPLEQVNDELLAPVSPAEYKDRDVLPQTEYWYELWVVDDSGAEHLASQVPIFVTTGGSYVTAFRSFSANPFRTETDVSFEIADAEGPASFTIYDVNGRLVRTLVSSRLPAGRYDIRWDGRNEAGQRLASGVYFCRFEAGGVRETASVVLLK